MPTALVYVGSLIVSEYFWAGVALIVVGTVWGQSEQRKAQREQEAAARAAYNAALKDRTATVIQSDQPYVYVYGKDVVVGSRIVDVLTTGDRDQYHHLICVHADHESEAITDIAINDKWLGPLDANGFVTQGDFYYTHPVNVNEYHVAPVFDLAHTPNEGTLVVTQYVWNGENSGYQSVPFTLNGRQVTCSGTASCLCSYEYTNEIPRVRVIKRLGAPNTPADAITIAECEAYRLANGKDTSEYTATCTLDEKTATIIRIDLDHDEFRSGIPTVKVKMNGKLVHDVRDPAYPLDAPKCSSNNALCIADYLTSPMCRVPVSHIPLDDYIAAANACDTVKTFGPLYTLNGTVRSDQDRGQALEAMALSMAGIICSTTWRIKAGVWSAPVMALTQDDIVGDFSFSAGSSDADLYNGIKGQWISEDNLWVATDYRPYQNIAYLAADGRELWANIDLPFTGDLQRVNNICRIITEDQRNAFTFEGFFSYKTWDQPGFGDRITFTSPFLGQAAKFYRVVDKKIGLQQAVWLKLKEDDPTIWDESDAVVPDSTPNTNLPDPFAIAPLASLTCASGTDILTVNGDGSVLSRMLITWPQSTTQGVVHGGVIEIEWRRFGSDVWSKTQVPGDATQAYLTPVDDGVFYNVRAVAVNLTLNARSAPVYATHQVVGKTQAPSDVSAIIAASDSLGIKLTWQEIPDADRNDYEIVDDHVSGSVTDYYPGGSARLKPGAAGLHTYRIRARDTSKLLSLNAASTTLNIQAPSAPLLTSAIVDGMCTLSWPSAQTTHQVAHYELRWGVSWAESTVIGQINALSYRLTADWSGDRGIFVRAMDVADNPGEIGSIVVTIAVPAAPAITAEFVAERIKLAWNVPASTLPVDTYEVRHGASWATGTSIGITRSQSFELRASFTGSRTFWLAATDRNGNVGTPGSVETIVNAAPAPSITFQVIDNNVLLYWTQVQGTLPTATYELRKGAAWPTAEPIGTKSGGFTTVFETRSGVFNYWIAAIDSAGNYGAPAAVSATVAQPPDYVLKADYDSLFTGTKTNMSPHGDNDGSWITPVNTAETIEQHFTAHGWATPQDQINAGFPVFIQPNLSPGSYEETIDYGVVLASNRITVTLSAIDLVGAVERACTISVSTDNSTWTDYVNVWQVYATNFRYVKVTCTFTAANSTDLLEVMGLNIRLDSKLKTVTKMVSCNSTDDGGTTVYLTDDWTATGNKMFIDVDAIALTPQGTTPLIALYDFVDAANPLLLKVLLLTSAGVRASGSVSMMVRGF